eukprot:8717504-Alexandrium_andersonii.AAC.1
MRVDARLRQKIYRRAACSLTFGPPTPGRRQYALHGMRGRSACPRARCSSASSRIWNQSEVGDL